MKEYIDKSALAAEIERRIANNKKEIERASHKNLEDYFEGYEDALALFKQQFLDTIEVKEMDLENEYKVFVEEDPVYNKLVNNIVGRAIAKHFFELGMQQAQKGNNWNRRI